MNNSYNNNGPDENDDLDSINSANEWPNQGHDEGHDEDNPIAQSFSLATQAYEKGDLKAALKHANQTLDLFNQDPVPDQDDHASVLEFRAVVYNDLNHPKKAISDITKAIDLWEQLIPRNIESLCVAYGNRAMYHLSLDDPKAALNDVDSAIECNQLIDPPDELAIAECYSTRGMMHLTLEQYDLAEQDYTKSITYAQSVAPECNEMLIMDLSLRARCRHMQGNQQDAIEDINNSFELYESHTPQNPDMRETLDMYRDQIMGGTLNVQLPDGADPNPDADPDADPDSPITQLRVLIKDFESTIGPSYHGLPTLYYSLAHALHESGEHTQALPEVETSLKLIKKHNPADHAAALKAYSVRADIHMSMGNHQAAAQDFSRIIKYLEDHPKAKDIHADHFLVYGKRAHVYYELQDFPNALKDFNHALKLLESSQDADSSDLAYVLSARARVHNELNNQPAALRDIDRSISMNRKMENNQDIVAVLLHARASFNQHFRDFEAAERDISSAIKICESIDYGEPFAVPAYYLLRADVRVDRKNYEGALVDLDQAIKCEHEMPELSYQRLILHTRLRSIVHRNLKNFDQSLADIEQVIAWAESDPEYTESDLVAMHLIRAVTISKSGKCQQAHSLLAKSLAWFTTNTPDDLYSIYTIHEFIAGNYARLSRFDEARKHIDHACKLISKDPTAEPHSIQELRQQQAAIHAGQVPD